MELILEIVLRGRNAVQDFNHSLKVELSHKLLFGCHFSEIIKNKNLGKSLSDKLNEDLLCLNILFVYQEGQDFRHSLDFLGSLI